MKYPRLLLCLALLALLAGCASPTAPALPAAPAASSSAGSPPGPDAATPGPDSLPAPGDGALVPPREPSPPPTEPLVRILEGESPARPTPSYFEPPAEELTLGIVTDAPPAVPAAAGQDRLLYADQTLHVWHVDDARDENLNWPPVAIDCPWLAPDGHTLFFSDQEGAKRVDLRAPEPPQLLVEHFTSDPNEARHRHFCVRGVSDDGQKLLLQASDNHWYQWGVLDQDTDALQVVESPFGPPGEPWYCPGAALWGQDGTLFVSGYSAGRCNQFPGLHVTHWGEPLVPTPVVTSTLPSLAGHPKQMGGAWSLSRSPDGSQVAFWLDEDWAREDGTFLSR
ncbi:MAG: hypothetical protein ACK2U9_20340, partial [Anaerolineae bacterium]